MFVGRFGTAKSSAWGLEADDHSFSAAVVPENAAGPVSLFHPHSDRHGSVHGETTQAFSLRLSWQPQSPIEPCCVPSLCADLSATYIPIPNIARHGSIYPRPGQTRYVRITAGCFLYIRCVHQAFPRVKNSIQHDPVGMGRTVVGGNNWPLLLIVPGIRIFVIFGTSRLSGKSIRWSPISDQIIFFASRAVEPDRKKRRLHRGPQSFS